MRKYVAYKIKAVDIDELYEKYKRWINAINKKSSYKTTIVSTNLVQNGPWCCMIITYSYK